MSAALVAATMALASIAVLVDGDLDLMLEDLTLEGGDVEGPEACGTLVARKFFRRPEHVPIVLALDANATSSPEVKELVNRLARLVEEFAAVSIVADRRGLPRADCENFVLVVRAPDALVRRSDFLFPRTRFNYSGRIIVVALDEARLRDVVAACWRLKMVNVVVVTTTGLYTYYPYAEGNCGNSDARAIGTCLGGDELNATSDLYPPKSLNMHGCPVRATVIVKFPYVVLDKRRDGTYDVRGIDGSLVKTLAELMNYTLHVMQPDDDDLWGFWNGHRWGGVAGQLVAEKADLGIGAYLPALARASVVDFSFGYDNVKLVWVIPRLERVPDILKLLMPFSGYVWLLTTTTLALIIGLLWFLKAKLPDRCVEARSVTLSVWQVTLGMALGRMPPGRFVCYVFAVWVWGSLVLRSTYQGGLVGSMTTTYYDDSVRTMRDLLDRGFHFYATPTVMQLLTNVTQPDVVEIVRRMNRVDEKGQDDAIWRIGRGEELAAVLRMKTRLPGLNFRFRGKGYLVGMEQTYRTQIITMAFRKRSPLLWSVNEYILRICEAGLIEKWSKDHSVPKFRLKKDPIVLALHHFLGHFMLLIVGIGLSIVVFAYEVYSKKNVT